MTRSAVTPPQTPPTTGERRESTQRALERVRAERDGVPCPHAPAPEPSSERPTVKTPAPVGTKRAPDPLG